MTTGKVSEQYEVFSPWADADSAPRRGLAPRVPSLEGKVIGLFENQKVSARPILNAVEKQLGKKYPTAKFSRFIAPLDIGPTNGPPKQVIDSKHKEKFEDWLKGVDAVITAVGD